MSRRTGAGELVRLVLDPGSWTSWDEPVIATRGQAPAYAAELAAARERTGLDEALITGAGDIHGRHVAVIACEFDFLAGSIGVAAAERLVRAINRATAAGLAIVSSPTSGGTRMQEGTVAFMQMVKISVAVAEHRAAGLPYLTYLRHPTTGGVLASWGSLGHVTVAEPGAMIGFLGPRVYEALYGEPFPPGVQVAENLYDHGLLDAVVPPEQLREVASRALEVLLAPRAGLPEVSAVPYDNVSDVPAWESIERSRRRDRPSVRALLKVGANTVTPLHGTGEGESGGLYIALAKFGAAPCLVVAQDRRREQAGTLIDPAALREARRGIRLAEELGLPLVTVIDTSGAELSRAAEESGLAGEIARCVSELVMASAPTMCVLLGQGAGGAALALLPADRVVAAQHAWLSPLPPEGASTIMHRTAQRAPEVAEWQGVRSLDLLRDGVVDRIVAEHPDAADEPSDFLARLAGVLEHELIALLGRKPVERLEARRVRYRRLGLD